VNFRQSSSNLLGKQAISHSCPAQTSNYNYLLACTSAKLRCLTARHTSTTADLTALMMQNGITPMTVSNGQHQEHNWPTQASVCQCSSHCTGTPPLVHLLEAQSPSKIDTTTLGVKPNTKAAQHKSPYPPSSAMISANACTDMVCLLIHTEGADCAQLGSSDAAQAVGDAQMNLSKRKSQLQNAAGAAGAEHSLGQIAVNVRKQDTSSGLSVHTVPAGCCSEALAG